MNKTPHDISGYLIVGGKSVRFGSDKRTMLVDGLPTMDAPQAKRGMVTGAERLRYHYDAINEVPSGIPVNILLYPMEGDYFASIAYWLLAYQTGGAFMSISKDWP